MLTSNNGKKTPRLSLFERRKNIQVELADTGKKEKYDVVAALAKALLVFMVSYGATCGFLNAYDMAYNWPLCAAGLLGLAVALSLIYETGKRWFTNLCVIGVFIVYAYVALKQFWVLNSGAYAVINEIYEAAQAYLGVTGGGLYNLQITDTYQTITAIALFVGVVMEILMIIRLQYKASLIRTVLLTFTLYFVPIYFEKMPDVVCLFMLVSGYVTIGILQSGRVKKGISKQIKQALPVGVAVSAVAVLLLGFVFPQIRYRAFVPKNPVKAETEETAVTFAQYGLMALFMNNSAGGGLNEGRLSQNAYVMPTDETHLIVRFTPYSRGTTYLKAFTGLDYSGDRWTRATDELGRLEDKMVATAEGRRNVYKADPQLQPRGVMEVFNVGAAPDYEYRPYYTDLDEIKRIAITDFPNGALSGMRYVYYPMVNDADVPKEGEEWISKKYLTVPINCKRAVTDACERANLNGTPEQIAEQVREFFAENYAYTLRPGYYFGTMDYVSYFLSKNKKGYCTHFASAGTMMLRNMGIPARYVEGYVFSYTDVVTDGELVQNADYADYYDGYSPLGETALMEVEVPDGQAHAWVEAYFEGKGWVVVDVTPAASLDEEETGSFWDSILGGGEQVEENAAAQQEAARYLENVLTGGMGILAVVVLAFLGIFLGRAGLAKWRESKLPGKERVQLEYERLTAWLKNRDEGFAALTTPKEELEWITIWYGVNVTDEFREELYATFFGPNKERDYENLRKRILEITKEVKSFRRKVLPKN